MKKLLTAIIVIAVIYLIGKGCDNATTGDDKKTDSSSSSSTITLNATVEFTGTQFVITNNDNFDYKNAKLTLNKKYKIEGFNLKAGETDKGGMMTFADGDGNRFTTMQKPQSFDIWCDLDGGKKGFYYGTWK